MNTGKVETKDKALLRKNALKLRNSLTQDDILQKSSAIINKLKTLEEFLNAKTVMCYLSFSSEVSTWDLAAHCLKTGKRLAVPKVVKLLENRSEENHSEENRSDMIACEVTDLEESLQPGCFGIMEPASDNVMPVPVGELDLIIVPGLLFDMNGYRLGYGGGYFDRFLGKRSKSCRSIGLCYEIQLVGNLPVEVHDLPVDKIITEARIIQPKQG